MPKPKILAFAGRNIRDAVRREESGEVSPPRLMNFVPHSNRPKRRMKDESRPVPRPFKMHWGKGEIIEEASYFGKYHEPSIQLMRYEDGSESVRFCYYSEGRFQRSPLMIGKEEFKKMKAALNKTPRLKRLLKALLT